MQAKVSLIGIVQDALQQDLLGTLKQLRTMGYCGLEGSLAKIEEHAVQTYSQALRDSGMELTALHTIREGLRDNMEAHLKVIEATGCRHVVISWAPADSLQQIKADAEAYAQWAPRLREAGARLCYHNHEHEFTQRLGAAMPMAKILQSSPSEDLALQFDVAWGTFGGIDPVAFIEQQSGRIPILHLKDLYDLKLRGCFTTLGTGLVDIRGCLQAGRESGVEYFTVEQDKPRRLQGLDLARASILNLRELGVDPI